MTSAGGVLKCAGWFTASHLTVTIEIECVVATYSFIVCHFGTKVYWLSGLKDPPVSGNSCMCSKHFEADSFEHPLQGELLGFV